MNLNLNELQLLVDELTEYCLENNIPTHEVIVVGMTQRETHPLQASIVDYAFMQCSEKKKFVLELRQDEYPDFTSDHMEEASDNWPSLWGQDTRTQEDFQMDDPDNKRD